MRASLVTILPMLAAAILVMVGGERVARREIERRTPADRGRLLDLADSFRAELKRLDAVYLGHLEDLSGMATFQKPPEIESTAAEICGVRMIRIFRTGGKDLTVIPSPAQKRLPEVELRDRKRPLDVSTAVVLDPALLDQPGFSEGIWISTVDPDLKAYCLLPQQGMLVVFLIDLGGLREKTAVYLGDWLTNPLAPLKEANERLVIETPAGATLVSLGPERHGPAAAVVPMRNLTGDWQVRAWDGLIVTESYDAGTLALALFVSLILAASGFALYAQQNRALKLAAERVSFVNRVSHELGTPLTNLSLNMDLALEALDSRPAVTRQRMGIVIEEIERLSRLVANVLTFSRRERDTLELKSVPCVPGEVIERTLASFRPALERRGIEISSDIGAVDPVVLDPDALRQITGNLLSNVEKYASAGHWMRLECSWDQGVLALSVRDRGPGIPVNFRQRVFIPFERVLDITSEGASGTGLGLAIGRDLAERMGGTLELLDDPLETVFRLRVPALRAPDVLTLKPDPA